MFLFATTNYLNPTSEIVEQSSVNITMTGNPSDLTKFNNEGNSLGWLPLASIMLAAIGYHIGLGPITWAYTGKKFFQISI